MRRSAMLLVGVLAIAAAIAGAASARAAEEINGTVGQITSSDPNFSTLTTLAKSAGLEDDLHDPRRYLTLFAPTNGAFRQLEKAAPGVTKALTDPKNKSLVVAVVKYHLSTHRLNAVTLREIGQKKGMIPTLFGGARDAKLALGLKPFTFTLTDSAGLRTATAIEPDIAADNGAIHVIDKVLLPRSVANALKKAGLLR
jgi:uncharacterized surface protein with fasciclin (FAS1) repeats